MTELTGKGVWHVVNTFTTSTLLTSTLCDGRLSVHLSISNHTDMSRTIAKTIRTVYSPLAGARRCYGYDATSGAGPSTSRWGDEARNPVVRDSLVPIVVEQTVCRSATSDCLTEPS
jgi:hypothetical protein